VVSAYLRKNPDGVYGLEHWIYMRQNYYAYYVFYTKFVKAIVGKRIFHQRLRNMAEGDEIIATVSDEALTLLGFDNNIIMWDDIWKLSEGEIRTVRHDETIPDKFQSKLLPMYTRTSRTDADNKQNTEDKRWNSEGITRFNELRQLVIQDREDNPDFKTRWLKQVREESKGALDNDIEDLEDCSKVEAHDDLFTETAAAQPVLNPAKQRLGVSNEVRSDSDSDSDSDASSNGD
jgi:hypothetical protein